MSKWAVALLLVVVLVQVPDVLSRNAGQTAVLASDEAAIKETELPGFQAALTGL